MSDLVVPVVSVLTLVLVLGSLWYWWNKTRGIRQLLNLPSDGYTFSVPNPIREGPSTFEYTFRPPTTPFGWIFATCALAAVTAAIIRYNKVKNDVVREPEARRVLASKWERLVKLGVFVSLIPLTFGKDQKFLPFMTAIAASFNTATALGKAATEVADTVSDLSVLFVSEPVGDRSAEAKKSDSESDGEIIDADEKEMDDVKTMPATFSSDADAISYSRTYDPDVVPPSDRLHDIIRQSLADGQRTGLGYLGPRSWTRQIGVPRSFRNAIFGLYVSFCVILSMSWYKLKSATFKVLYFLRLKKKPIFIALGVLAAIGAATYTYRHFHVPVHPRDAPTADVLPKVPELEKPELSSEGGKGRKKARKEAKATGKKFSKTKRFKRLDEYPDWADRVENYYAREDAGEDLTDYERRECIKYEQYVAVNPQYGSESLMPELGIRKILCPYLSTYGKCKYSDSTCKFSHPANYVHKPHNHSGVPVCPFLKANAVCKFENDEKFPCKFKHQQYQAEHIRLDHAISPVPFVYSLLGSRKGVEIRTNAFAYADKLFVPRHGIAGCDKVEVITPTGKFEVVPKGIVMNSISDCVMMRKPNNAVRNTVAKFRAPNTGEGVTLFFIGENGSAKFSQGSVGEPLRLGSDNSVETFEFIGSTVSGACGGVYISARDGAIVGWHGVGARTGGGKSYPLFYPASASWTSEATSSHKTTEQYLPAVDISYEQVQKDVINGAAPGISLKFPGL